MGQDLSSVDGATQCARISDHVLSAHEERVADAACEARDVVSPSLATTILPSQDSDLQASSSEEDFYTPKSTSSRADLGGERCVIVFDWDDTLLCSTAVKMRFGCSDPEQLRELEQTAAKTLEDAQAYGEVMIITNGNENWIHESARRHLPGLLPTLEKFRCISARHMFEREYPGDPFMWKRAAFLKVFVEGRVESEAKLNLVAIGDQMPEIDAARIVGSTLGECCRVKTIKFQEQPSVADIIGQLRKTQAKIGRAVAEDSCGWTLVRNSAVARSNVGDAAEWKFRREADVGAACVQKVVAPSLSIKNVWPLLS